MKFDTRIDPGTWANTPASHYLAYILDEIHDKKMTGQIHRMIAHFMKHIKIINDNKPENRFYIGLLIYQDYYKRLQLTPWPEIIKSLVASIMNAKFRRLTCDD